MKEIAFLVALLLPFSASAKLMDIQSFELDNGLKTVVIENHKAPVILQMLYYKTGAINDPKGKGGIAHLLEHLMFRGTKNVPDQMFNRLTDEHGASNNAYTTYSVTGYYEFSDITKLELMMALEADRMHNLAIDEKAFLKERSVVLEERMQRFETKPTPLFYENLNKFLWQDHPLANPVSGSVAEINALTKADAEAFYHRWYRPDNALLVLAGDINLKDAKFLVNKYYGRIKKGKDDLVVPDYSGAYAGDNFIETKLAGVEQPRFVSYRRIDAKSLNKKDVLALSLLAEYLCGDDTSYLYDRLVYDKKELLSIDMGISYDNQWGGTFGIYAVPASETLRGREISEIIENEMSEGISLLDVEKLEKIKNQTLADTIYLQENPESAARFVGAMILDDYTEDEIMHYDERIKEITVEDVLAAWNKIKAASVMVKGYLEGK